MSTAVAIKSAQAHAASDALAEVPGVAAVCVFGSVARGRADAGSDIDLLVLGSDTELSASALRALLPEDLRSAPISFAYHTTQSLDRYLRRWSRFGAHLRREGVILHDPSGDLRRAFAADVPVSTEYEIAAQQRHLDNYARLERFGGRFLFTLAHLHRIGRTVVFAVLAEGGILEFDRDRAFDELARQHPDAAADVVAVARLAPFHELVTNRGSAGSLPFDPYDCEPEVIHAREAVRHLLALSRHSA